MKFKKDCFVACFFLPFLLVVFLLYLSVTTARVFFYHSFYSCDPPSVGGGFHAEDTVLTLDA